MSKERDNLIKALIAYADPPSGKGSEDILQRVDDFFEAYQGGHVCLNTEAIPDFLEIRESVNRQYKFKIGDVIEDTEAYGTVEVRDIYRSITDDKEVLYLVMTTEGYFTTFATQEELETTL